MPKFRNATDNQFIGFCVVRKANLALTKTNKQYANLRVYDGSEEITGRIWDFTGPLPEENSVVKIKGIMGEFNGANQITISNWRPAKKDEYDPAEFLPAYKGDKNALFNVLATYVNEIQNPNLKAMVDSIVYSYMSGYYDAPAAKTHHHAYLGGLLEHTCSVVKIAKFLYEQHPEGADLDIILAGAILHDLGKIEAYSWEGCSIDMSSKGKLVDHIPLGIMMLQPFLQQNEIPQEMQESLLHIIVSHHGYKEWGSPVEPATKEAMIVHLADLADGKLKKITEKAEKEGTPQ